MAAVFWLFARDMPGPVARKSLGDSLAILRSERRAWILSLFYFLTFGGFVALGNYLPKLLIDWFHLDKGDNGLRAAGFTVLATLARPVGGWLADQLGGQRVLTAVFAAGPLGALALAWLASGTPTLGFATGLFLVTAGWLGLGNGAVFKLVAEYFPKNTGLVTGVVGCAGGLGGFFPPLLMGAVKGATGGYAWHTSPPPYWFLRTLILVANTCSTALWRQRLVKSSRFGRLALYEAVETFQPRG